MAEIVADCPRCGAKHVTFDVFGCQHVGTEHDWLWIWEVFCICRRCQKSSTFFASQREYEDCDELHKPASLVRGQGSLERKIQIRGLLTIKDAAAAPPPEFLPADIHSAFREGATCVATGCFNAAAAMFRLCIDLATKPLLPDPKNEGGPNARQRRDLGLRLPWLFENGLIPKDLEDLSTCIKEDGNDGAHAGNLTRPDAEDLVDFASALLERLFTEPERLRQAKARRDARRAPPSTPAG